MEKKQIFSHSSGWRSLPLSLSWLQSPSSASHSSCSQLCADRLEGITCDLHTLTCVIALLCCCAGKTTWIDRWMCISVLCEIDRESANHAGKKTCYRGFKRGNHQTAGLIPVVNDRRWTKLYCFQPWGSIKDDCLFSYELTFLYWATVILSLPFTAVALSCSDLSC